MEKHILAGNNTSEGFCNYFDYIINPEEADRIYIIKGGPGVGKSSFMKKIAQFFAQKGVFIEYIHCSTDYNSLDGIHIPDYKFAMVDGTPPHLVEAKFPGLVEKVLDFGNYLDGDLLKKYRKEIIDINKEKSRLYKAGYRHLEVAGILLNENSQIYNNLTNYKEKTIQEIKIMNDFNKLIESKASTITLSIDQGIRTSAGKTRKAFLESHTPNGYISYTEKLCKDKLVWSIISPNHNHIAHVLEKILSIATLSGLSVEGYYMPLFPRKLQHIYIKDLDLMIVSSNNEEDIKASKVYPLYQSINSGELKLYQSEINYNQELHDLAISNASKKFIDAKKKHEVLEKIYIESMDFSKVDLLYEKIISKWLKVL